MDVHYRIGATDFVWDAAKAASTWRQRGIRFEDAATVFMDPLLVLIDASRKDEARDAVIGFDQLGRLLYVVHVEFEGERICIISARPAEPHEEALYAR